MLANRATVTPAGTALVVRSGTDSPDGPREQGVEFYRAPPFIPPVIHFRTSSELVTRDAEREKVALPRHLMQGPLIPWAYGW